MFLKPAYHDPQIEIVAHGPRLHMLMRMLGRCGLRPVRAAARLDSPGAAAILFDQASVTHTPDLSLCARPLVWLGTSLPTTDTPDDMIVLDSESHLDSLVHRLAAVRRERLRASESALRIATAKQFSGSTLKPTTTQKPIERVLFIGAFDPQFLAIQRAFSDYGVSIVGALSVETALLHIAAYQFPIILIDQTFANESVAAIAKLQSQCPQTHFVALQAPTDPTVLDGTLDPTRAMHNEIAHMLRRVDRAPMPTQVTHARLSTLSHDSETGVFSNAFLKAHLDGQIASAIEAERPLALLQIRRDTAPDSGAKTRMSDMATLIATALRETDLLARTGQDSFVVSLSDCDYAGAARLARRLATRLSEYHKRGPLSGEVYYWRAVERRDHHSAESLLNAAMTGPLTRAVAA